MQGAMGKGSASGGGGEEAEADQFLEKLSAADRGHLALCLVKLAVGCDRKERKEILNWFRAQLASQRNAVNRDLERGAVQALLKAFPSDSKLEAACDDRDPVEVLKERTIDDKTCSLATGTDTAFGINILKEQREHTGKNQPATNQEETVTAFTFFCAHFRDASLVDSLKKLCESDSNNGDNDLGQRSFELLRLSWNTLDTILREEDPLVHHRCSTIATKELKLNVDDLEPRDQPDGPSLYLAVTMTSFMVQPYDAGLAGLLWPTIAKRLRRTRPNFRMAMTPAIAEKLCREEFRRCLGEDAAGTLATLARLGGQPQATAQAAGTSAKRSGFKQKGRKG